MSHVLVLNATYEPLSVCTTKRAAVLLLKEKAEAVEVLDDRLLRAEKMALACPSVIRLVTYVRLPRDVHRRITRRAVLARDEWVCQYCGSTSRLTIDHVVPRSKGGLLEWENVVAACGPCNARKQNYLPHEVGLTLRRKPRPPAPTVFVQIAVRRVPDAWTPYVEAR